MQADIRMEQTAMSIASAIFEKLQGGIESFANGFLYSVFSCMHYYRNNTKSKIVPVTISKAIWSVFATFVIYHGTQGLVTACDKI